MENDTALLKAANEEVNESRRILEELANQVRDVGGIVEESLMAQIERLRSARMTAIREVRESLAALRDIRAFFLEADYEKEVLRMERLLGLCREFQAAKATGVLDVVCDAALRLAVKDEAPK
jgi:hypothetical protein